MVNFKDLLGEDANLQDLLLDAVEEGDFVVVGKDKEGNAIGFVLINSEINKHLPECRRKLHYL